MKKYNKRIVFDLSSKIEKRAFLVNEKDKIEKYYFDNALSMNIQGSIYIVKVVYVDYKLKMVFVDYGGGRNGFISLDDISDFYLSSDFKKRLFPIDLSGVEKSDVLLEDYATKNEYLAPSEAEEEGSATSGFVKPGQYLLVQAIKNASANKGPAFSTRISFNTQYFLFIPFDSKKLIGVSKNLSHIRSYVRGSLYHIFHKSFEKNDTGLIARSSSAKAAIHELVKDLDVVVKIWNSVVSKVEYKVGILYKHDNFLQDVIYEFNSDKIHEIVLNNQSYVKDISMINKNLKVRYENLDFIKYDTQVLELYQTHVGLESGGHLVIQKTEALHSVDVNSGASVNKTSVDKVNQEAAYELVRQIRLRNLSGMIVVDFIDHKDENGNLKNILLEGLSEDKVRVNVLDMNDFGLICISRQRKGLMFFDLNNQTCKLCSGKGFLRGNQVVYMFKIIERKVIEYGGQYKSITIVGNTAFVENVINLLKNKLVNLEKMFNMQIHFRVDSSLSYERFILEASGDVVFRYDEGRVLSPKQKGFFSRLRNMIGL